MIPPSAAHDPDTREAAVMSVLRAVRDFGDAHDRMYSGMKGDMKMNVTDIATLRMLVMRAESGQLVSPADIARHLRISTASTSKLLDRLTESGHLRRAPHPTDRRARIVELTDKARSDFFRLFGQRLRIMRAAMEGFSAEELTAASDVLRVMSDALDTED